MLNHITIMGRLVREPELKSTSNGTKVATFRIASDRDNATNGEKQADFVDCVAWRQRGEFVCRNFHKGMPILIEGRLQIRDYKDRDGNNRKATEILVENSYFCGGDRQQKKAEAGLAEIDDSDGELPWATDDDEDLPL